MVCKHIKNICYQKSLISLRRRVGINFLSNLSIKQKKTLKRAFFEFLDFLKFLSGQESFSPHLILHHHIPRHLRHKKDLRGIRFFRRQPCPVYIF